MKVLELYSGIGGMHAALKTSKIQGAEVKAAIDINLLSNEVYQHNFPETYVLNKNIQGLTAEFLHGLNIDTILMSPPCQPFTRNGLQKDLNDPRTTSFCSLLKLLPELSEVQNILMENVKGFECSAMHELFVEVLSGQGFDIEEYLLCPSQLGVPNSRTRYYLLAKRTSKESKKGKIYQHQLKTELKCNNLCSSSIKDILEEDLDASKYLLPLETLKKWYLILDICYFDSKRSCCFTKSYGRYIKGTGSVLTDKSPQEVEKVYRNIENGGDFNEILSLNLRFFTPKEVSLLMCFPGSFSFPKNLSNKNCYMLLGNSINVKVVSELIKLF